MAAKRAKLVGSGQLAEEEPSRPLKVRTFFGLPLPETHRHALGAYIEDCVRRAPEFRWTPASNLHLTVRFLGHVEMSLAAGIAAALAASELRAFDLQLGAIGTFRRGPMARVVWIGLSAGETEIGELATTVEAACARAGLEPDERRFHAHLTLARAKARDGAAPPPLTPPSLPAWRADELVLYQSHLGRGGSVYEPLRRIRLS